MAVSDIYHRIPKRYVLSILGFLGFFNALILRSNLSIAIVAMVKPTIEQLPNNITKIEPATFNWDTKTQGFILSGYFYSYAAAQIPAGFLATRFGGRNLFGGGIGITAGLALFIPLCARGGPGLLIFIRVIQGFASSFIYPSLHALWAKWAPKNDKTKLTTFAFSGGYVGIFVAMILGGLIAGHWSWEWIFYLSGISGLLWAIAWFYLTSESPSTHPTISDQEAKHIEQNVSPVIIRTDAIPWKAIVISLPVWAIVVAHLGTNWVIYTMLTELPTFLVKSLGFRVAVAGSLAALPWLAIAVLVYAAGYFSDKLAEKYTTVHVRKLIMAISFIIVLLGLLLVTLMNTKHQSGIVAGVIVALAACGLAWASFGVNHLDIGGHYAGILMGISNCVGTVPGFVVPVITGYIVQQPQLKSEWNEIFIIAIVVSVLSLMFYTFFAAGELQSWAIDTSDEYQHVLNNPISSRDISERSGLNESNIDELTDRLKAEIHDEPNAE